uniref:Protein phosphatase n=1 Tax=Compsopogon caeruleus TaxID=31354 RepID=A0A7S1XCJ3_9RHOD|mmetsp:Transcript_13020/g.26391  ORF Transcript_13020/g.26391 Transcript_13020/m.26391 type:complete len:344 (+) Transcript_13020:73-1104(+)
MKGEVGFVFGIAGCQLGKNVRGICGGRRLIQGVNVGRVAVRMVDGDGGESEEGEEPRKVVSTVRIPLFGKIMGGEAAVDEGTEEDLMPGVPLRMECGFGFYAHPKKQTGEDAFFIEGCSVGVFDGVTGVQAIVGKVDPRLFPQDLARITADKVRVLGPQSVVKALIEAADEVKTPGASTAVVVGMDDKARVFGIHLGDSGVILVRDGKIAFRTTEQMKSFGAPYQLGSKSPYNVLMGQNIQFKAKENDWIIIASDGLFDNVFDQTIVDVVQAKKQEGAFAVAETLGVMAWENCQDTKIATPYAAAARKAGKSHSGGKLDDVTVVACRVARIPDWTPVSIFSDF